jgi:hypothetical protein
MTTRFGATLAIAALLAASAPHVLAQTPASKPAQASASAPATKASSAAGTKALKPEDLLPLTCAQAWAAAGKKYPAMFDIVATLATVSLANRDLTFPNTKEAGMDAGKGIAEDCTADPQSLLFAIVDKHVRHVAEAAAR